MARNFTVVLEGLYLDADIPFALYVADVAVNAVFSITTVIGNSLIMVALRKLSSAQVYSVFKVFLFSLALADLGVGLVVQPLYITAVLTAMYGHHNVSRIIGAVFYLLNWFLPNMSFATLTGIAIDRFLALHLRLRYRSVVTASRVTKAMVAVWIFALASTTILTWNDTVYNVIVNIMIAVCIVITTSCYLFIYRVLRQREKRASPTCPVADTCQRESGGRRFNLERYKRSISDMLYVNIAFVMCCLPLFSILIVILVQGANRATNIVRFLGATVIFINSSLNPLLYCWKIRKIRRVAFTTLTNIFCCKRNE